MLVETPPERAALPQDRPLRVHFSASSTPVAQAARAELTAHIPDAPPDEADVVVSLGGDGYLLHVLHQRLAAGGEATPVYGMNRGSVGFLLNNFHASETLDARLRAAELTRIEPLRLRALGVDGAAREALAINEVSLLRETRQSAKLAISVDGTLRMPELIGDGALVATPAGSTAYNLSAHGPILPMGAQLLALTPISAFRPRRWRGAILPRGVVVRFDVGEPLKRPVSAVADFHEFRDVRSAEIASDPTRALTLLFDPGGSLAERLMAEQFVS